MQNTRMKFCAIVTACLLLTGCGQEKTPQAYMERAESALAQGDNATAIIELKNALKLDRGNSHGRLLLGLAYFDIGDMPSAEKELLEAGELASESEHSRQQEALARAWIDLGKFEDVLTMGLVRLDKAASANVLSAKAQAYMARSDFASARQRLERALDADSGSVYARYTQASLFAAEGDRDQALEVLAQLVADAPDYARAWALRGALQWQRGNLEAADEYYSEALSLSPNSLLFRLNRAFARLQANNFDAAKQDLDILQKAVPQSTRVNYALGVLYFQQGNYRDANSALIIAEPDKFDIPEILLYLGMTNMQLGELDRALGYVREYHALNDSNIVASRLLATLLVSTGDFMEAEQHARDVLEQFPNDSAALNALASVLISQGRTEEAIATLSHVVELNPDSLEAQLRLGASYAIAGRSEEAVDLIQSAVALDPESGKPDAVLIFTHLRNGDNGAALEAAQDFVERQPDSPTAHVMEGIVRKQIGEPELAAEAFTRASELEPGHPGANHQLASLAIARDELDRARDHYQTVLGVHENLLPTLLAAAALEGYAREFDAMEGLLQRAVEAHPGSLKPRLSLAQYYLSTGQPEKVAVVLADLPPEQAAEPPVLRARAMSRVALEEYADAEAALAQLTASAAPSVQDLQLSAYVKERQGQLDKAAKHLERAAELEPGNVAIQLALGRIAFTEGDEAALAGYMSNLDRLSPDDPMVLQLKAAIARKEGDQARALALLQRVQEQQPSTVGVANLVRQYDLMGDREASRELLEAWAASATGEDNAGAIGMLAMRFQEEGDYQAAVDKYEQYLQRDPDNIVANNNLAWLLKDSEPARALQYARRASELTNGQPQVEDTLAMVLAAAGEYTEAAEILRELVAAQPENGTFRYHQAVVFSKQGQTEKARRILQELTRSDSDFSERKEAVDLLASLQGGQ
ncbi:XrtA/PEP-CTERM system TPR-repeat protein PrsT [Parahaliea mediterranea]|uniref:PEP-CTERM system TPR-repeat protein PrsT n=1 Tax=Parahaliea mediterranea TaxID=651086 RepID=A0A939DG72_9GAMM|nr:XrtA/PEP-CTERM system TPR-repeat protein PrsT [Parahaliea mediterranea]MBN7797469.1 PEP-CTERM system TPR-repeat protein PrsT [Parahaliea mediterranea]